MNLLTSTPTLLVLALSSALAHEVRPAFLELTERAPGEFDVLWKVPAAGGLPPAGEEIPHEPGVTTAADPGADGKLPPVGNTVDVKNATWKNTIGTPELITTWTDPDFDAKESAFYYARVIEIPTLRWTAFSLAVW